MGTFQEGSKDLHALLETLADCKLRAMGLARGREGTERERSTFLTQLRRELSTVGAKAQSSCLLGRVSRVGEGHRAAAKRRAWVRKEGERWEDAMKAHWVANVRERGVFRGRGQLMFNL